MRYSKISPDSDITLISVIRSGNTPAKAINEAKDFLKEHGLSGLVLIYGGFTMYIDSEIDVNELVSEFYHWRGIQTAP
jgi:hypothetical protein